MDKETKSCPFCGGEILITAKKCKHCKKFLIKDENISNSDNKNASTTQISKNNIDKKCIIGAIVGIIIFCIFFNNSSNTLLSGCEVESERNYLETTHVTYYCKNKPYHKVVLGYSNRELSDYPDYGVFNKDDKRIASMYRKDGEYYCSLFGFKDTISPCNKKEFANLIKDNIEKIEDNIEFARVKENLRHAISDFISESEYYNGDNISPNCSKLASSLKRYGVAEDINGCQARLNSGVIISISEDCRSATIYDDVNPKYFVNVTQVYNQIEDEYGYVSFQKYTDYTNNKILANNYIKNSNNAKQLTKEDFK